MKRNVILADYNVNENWDFKIAVEKKTGKKWEIKKEITDRLHGKWYKTFLRYIRYFVFSFAIFIERNKYSDVIAWQQFYGLLMVLYCSIFKVKKYPDIYIMSFIYKPKKTSLYYKFIRYIVKSGYIKKIIVLSDGEKNYYANLFNIDPKLFYCSRIGVPDIASDYQKLQAEKYYLTVGRSNRDYTFLRNAWKREYGRLVVISDSYKESNKEEIECFYNCYGDKYFQKLANCYAVIIPLQDERIASGSLSFLQAMMFSLPTIVTENSTVHDYIENGYNGYIIPKNNMALEDAIKKLDDEKQYIRIAKNARKTYTEKFSEYSLGMDIGEMINQSKKNGHNNEGSI